MGHPPGHYLIEFDVDGKPTLHTSEGALLLHHQFDATAGIESSFIFRIASQDPQALFSQSNPISWFTPQKVTMAQPSDIHPAVSGDRKEINLLVHPPATANQEIHFQFNFQNGQSLDPLDPTIIEKPEEPPCV